jgi:hypothetical protein
VQLRDDPAVTRDAVRLAVAFDLIQQLAKGASRIGGGDFVHANQRIR